MTTSEMSTDRESVPMCCTSAALLGRPCPVAHPPVAVDAGARPALPLGAARGPSSDAHGCMAASRSSVAAPDAPRLTVVEPRHRSTLPSPPRWSGDPVPPLVFARTLGELVALQWLSAELRSVAHGNDGSGGLREDTATDRALDRGDLARARVASQRMGRMPYREREVLRWLADRAHAAIDLPTAALGYAAHHAPMPLREAAQSAPWARSRADTAAAAATRTAAGVLTTALLAARSLAATCHAREAQATAALLAWGVAEVSGAVEAWVRAGDGAEG